MSGDGLGLLAAAVVLGTGVVWVRLIRAVRVPRVRAPYLAMMGVGALLGVAALARGVGAVGGVAAWVAILAGGFFVVLRLQSAQASGEPTAKPGGPIPDFSATDDEGNPFALASLSGRPFLLKFFRGHW